MARDQKIGVIPRHGGGDIGKVHAARRTEGGKATFPEELHLGDTPEAAHLKKLLRDEGADGGSVSIPVGSMIVASGGGGTKGEKPKSSRAKTNGNDK